MIRLRRMLVLAAALVLHAELAAAQGVNYTLDPAQGFQFRREQQGAVGYLTRLRIGTTDFPADITLTRADGTTGTVVGVLSSLAWNAGPADPIAVAAQVSANTRMAIQQLLKRGVTDPTVIVGLEAWQYDAEGRVWFRTFTPSPGELKAVLGKNGGGLAISVGESPGVVPSPPNWPLMLQVLPGRTVQSVRVGTTSNRSLQRSWGVPVQ